MRADSAGSPAPLGPPGAPESPDSPTSTDPIGEIIAYARRDILRSIPERVARQAKRLLLDGISWMILGARREEAAPLLRAATTGASGGQCTVIGSGARADLQDALFANTALAQIYDCNDGRRLAKRAGSTNHPGRCVIPAALTIGEQFRLSGTELLSLLVIGYEIVSRVQLPYPDMGYGVTVAALLARAQHMDDATARRAITLSRLIFPATAATELGDTDFDFLRQGFIARAAAGAVRFADTARSLPAGSSRMRLSSDFPGTESGDHAGYEILDVYIKPYPCGRALHGAIDLAREIRALPGFDLASVAEIEIRVGNTKPYLFEPAGPDASYKRCQFSIPFATACALLDGDVSETSFSEHRIASPEVASLQAKVRCHHDQRLRFNPFGLAAHFRPTILTVRRADGSLVRRESASPHGSPLNPLSDNELLAKFRAWTGPGLSEARKQQVVELVRDLESLDDVSRLVRLL